MPVHTSKTIQSHFHMRFTTKYKQIRNKWQTGCTKTQIHSLTVGGAYGTAGIELFPANFCKPSSTVLKKKSITQSNDEKQMPSEFL